MSRLTRFRDQQIITGKDLNILLATLDSGGISNLQSQTNSGTTGQGLTSTAPQPLQGSIAPGYGSISAPQTPIGVTAVVGIDNYSQTHDGFAVLSWTPNPVLDYIARYDIYYHKGSIPDLHNVTVGGDVSSVRINGLIPGQTYVFAIQAHDAANHSSGFSQELTVYIPLDTDSPAVPTGLTVTAFTKAIFVQWTEVGAADGISSDLKQYQVQIDTSSSFNVSPYIATIGPGNNFYYPYASSGTVLYFRIRSADWTGNVSAWSGTVNATVG